MQYAEILEECKKLTLIERLALVEAVVPLMCEELQQLEQPSTRGSKARQLAAAAHMLRANYAEDSALTSFTALDSEDLHEDSIVPMTRTLPRD